MLESKLTAPMIDRASGAISIGTIALGPEISGEAFTRAHGATTLRAVRDGDHTWMLAATFAGSRLAQVTLLADDASFGAGWDDYTEEKELARRAVHDALLTSSLGPAHRTDDAHFFKEWTLPWGRVISSHDPRGGTTDIQIIYR